MADEPEVVKVKGRRITEEETYYLEQAYKEPVEGIARIEEAARFLMGATATVAGLFLAALRWSFGKDVPGSIVWALPFVCWAASMIALTLVFVPLRYEAGQNEAEAWKAAFLRARSRKYVWLVVGVALFIVGMLAGVFQMSMGGAP